MDFTDRSGRISEAEDLDHNWSPFCMPTDRDRLAFYEAMALCIRRCIKNIMASL